MKKRLVFRNIMWIRFVVLIVVDDNCLVNSNLFFNCFGYINESGFYKMMMMN